ncbi:hypothetical protein E4U41_001968 [Claviceps citrina]|nr:hypothetical protein E4U41_001968 [Claviceps citrina]
MATSNDDDGTASSSSQDCSICLISIAPCQSLFVAPCSHTWHFKCVRSLLTSPQYPIFVCPNCRAGADLEADVDEPTESLENAEPHAVRPPHDDEQPDGDVMDVDRQESERRLEPERASAPEAGHAPSPSPNADADADSDAMDMTVSFNASNSPNARCDGGVLPQAVSAPLCILNPASGSGRVGHLGESRSPPRSFNGAENPITPRNNAGPWVFDGSAGRRVVDGDSELPSLDAAAGMDVSRVSNKSDESIR